MNKKQRAFLERLIPISEPRSDVSFAIVMRIEDAALIARGSKGARCGLCMARVWVQAETRRLAPNATLCCVQCMPKLPQEST